MAENPATLKAYLEKTHRFSNQSNPKVPSNKKPILNYSPRIVLARLEAEQNTCNYHHNSSSNRSCSSRAYAICQFLVYAEEDTGFHNDT